jgi:hypothetical protein
MDELEPVQPAMLPASSRGSSATLTTVPAPTTVSTSPEIARSIAGWLWSVVHTGPLEVATLIEVAVLVAEEERVDDPPSARM